uniref:Uncharacterized protein n=1 Tax=Plectus sambesii TaxID=2011161 RepID=A0A914VV52_9BILA
MGEWGGGGSQTARSRSDLRAPPPPPPQVVAIRHTAPDAPYSPFMRSTERGSPQTKGTNGAWPFLQAGVEEVSRARPPPPPPPPSPQSVEHNETSLRPAMATAPAREHDRRRCRRRVRVRDDSIRASDTTPIHRRDNQPLTTAAARR